MSQNGNSNADGQTLLRTPLHGFHQRHRAKLAPFAGYEMPIQYPTGIIEEHRRVRADAGLFDVSHMLQTCLTGADATSLLARACPMTSEDLPEGRSRYSMLLNEAAGVIDDLIATRLDANAVLIVSNASRRDQTLSHLESLAEGYACQVEPQCGAMLALQGPKAAELLDRRFPGVAEMAYLDCRMYGEIRVVRCGYTGESGYEVALTADEAEELAESLVEAGAAPAGLGARDCLRMEAGLCLYGQDLTEETSPIEAGLAWTVTRRAREAEEYVGAAALASRPVTRRLVGLRPQERAPVRAGAQLYLDGEPVGIVTSGGYGPTVEAPIALGYVPLDLAAHGTAIDAEVRNRYIACVVAPLPFVPHRFRT